ncbi:MAG: hypothetical protein LBM18_03950 [Oscillospiraceae bacterium]|jgi:sporulation protein YqfC|nr:hypothetical protein [Oscillospiraceae bacterium]
MKRHGWQSLPYRLELPGELMPGEPRITVTGGEVCIENHAGLKTYLSDCVEVKSRDGLIRIKGDGLKLAAMTRSDIVVRGFVICVERL